MTHTKRTVHGRKNAETGLPDELRQLDRALEYWNLGHVVDTKTGEQLTVSEALARGLIQINWETGMITDNRTKEVCRMNFHFSFPHLFCL